MKYLIALLLVSVVLFSGCTTPSQKIETNPGFDDLGKTVTGDVVVEIKDNACMPNEITIAKGTTVIWKNDDIRPHTVYIESTGKGSPAINPGKSYSYTFTESGRFQYHCSFHSGMKAVINVQ